MLESTRAKELAVKEETREQLEVFRKQQEEADKKVMDGGKELAEETAGSPTGESNETQWTVHARKRKRVKDDLGLKGGKIRKASSTSDASPPAVSQSDERIGGADARSILPKGPERTSSGISVDSSHTGVRNPTGPSQQTESTNSAKAHCLTGLGLAEYSSDDD